MLCRRLQTPQLLACALIAHLMMIIAGESSSEVKLPALDVDKRYLAALARNGKLAKIQMDQDRLKAAAVTSPPNSKVIWVKKPSESVEKDSLDPDDIDKRYVGAFLSSRGRPAFAAPDTIDESDDSKEKRNIGALARMGWITTARSYRSPKAARRHQVDLASSIKREDLLYGDGPSSKMVDEGGEENCVDEQRNSTMNSPEKRNIAALARNGRLPPFRSNWDYWSLKRNPLIRYSQGSWPSAPVILAPQHFGNSKRYNYMRFMKSKNKRCRRRPQSAFNDVQDKRNIAALARKGILPQRRAARKGISPRGGVASMASLLPSPQRRNVARLARQGILMKKNVVSMARKGMLPS